MPEERAEDAAGRIKPEQGWGDPGNPVPLCCFYALWGEGF